MVRDGAAAKRGRREVARLRSRSHRANARAAFAGRRGLLAVQASVPVDEGQGREPSATPRELE